ncbi:MAG: hypothetical protein IPK04_17130 [Bdellovibrionales bacterium]|nr:hypothetical protein [Bdellovibrionales bacterium]
MKLDEIRIRSRNKALATGSIVFMCGAILIIAFTMKLFKTERGQGIMIVWAFLIAGVAVFSFFVTFAKYSWEMRIYKEMYQIIVKGFFYHYFTNLKYERDSFVSEKYFKESFLYPSNYNSYHGSDHITGTENNTSIELSFINVIRNHSYKKNDSNGVSIFNGMFGLCMGKYNLPGRVTFFVIDFKKRLSIAILVGGILIYTVYNRLAKQNGEIGNYLKSLLSAPFESSNMITILTFLIPILVFLSYLLKIIPLTEKSILRVHKVTSIPPEFLQLTDVRNIIEEIKNTLSKGSFKEMGVSLIKDKLFFSIPTHRSFLKIPYFSSPLNVSTYLRWYCDIESIKQLLRTIATQLEGSSTKK